MAYFPPTGSTVAYQVVPSSLLVGASIFGLPPVNITNTNLNVGGSVISFQGGTQITSIVSGIPSSVIVGASIFGQLPAGTAPLGSVATLQGTSPWIITGSVQGFPTTQNVSGSVVAFQGAGWSGSVAATVTNTNLNVSGSVVAFQGTTPWVIQSIVGTYAEDSGHTTADKGIFTLGVRNDAVASLASADLEYGAFATDSTGRTVIKPFAPEQSVFRFSTSVVSGSVTLIQASSIGKHSYITDFSLVNSGSVATLITFQDGSASIVGYAVAPAGTGALSPGLAVPLRTVGRSQDLTFKQAPSASILYLTVTGYQAE